jgi:hypothetical protein
MSTYAHYRRWLLAAVLLAGILVVAGLIGDVSVLHHAGRYVHQATRVASWKKGAEPSAA